LETIERNCVDPLVLLQVSAALQLARVPPATVALHWLNQVFWDHLCLQDIVGYLSICLVHGVDYQVYFTVCVFRHMGDWFIQDAASLQPHSALLHTALDLNAYGQIPFMHELATKYRGYCLGMMGRCVSFA
jgi:hypothetical protein